MRQAPPGEVFEPDLDLVRDGTSLACTKESPIKVTWQPAAVRSGDGGGRSRKPQRLARETVQNSDQSVQRTSKPGSFSIPTRERTTGIRSGA